MLALAAACALGVCAGLGFAWLWLRVVPPGTNRRFWSGLSVLTREMLQIEALDTLLALYRRLGRLAGAYVARNLAGIALACLPMLAILLAVSPFLPERSATCSSSGYCLLLDALAFETTEVPAAPGAPPYRVLRAEPDGVNPLWPLLSDAEALFFLAFVLSTLGGLLWRNPRHSLKPATTP